MERGKYAMGTGSSHSNSTACVPRQVSGTDKVHGVERSNGLGWGGGDSVEEPATELGFENSWAVE